MESSRIFVRGLPPKFTEDDVRKHFAKFPITDVKFFPHRRIGYVGYKTPEDAAKAVKYFNKTFIKLTKIYAEIARPVSSFHLSWPCTSRLTCSQIADKELPKSRRQQKAERSAPREDAYIAPRQENDLKRKREEAEQDPKLKEFLEAYQPASKTTIWTNGDALGLDTSATVEDTVPAVAVPEDESDNEYQVITKKAKTAPEPTQLPVNGQPIANDDRTAEAEEDVVDGGEAMEDVQDAPAAEEGPMTDADWLRSRTNRVLELVEDDEDPSATAPPVREPSPEPQTEEPAPAEVNEEQVDNAAPSEEEEDKIRETGRLYLRNLHFEVTEDELREHFSKHGALEEVSQYLLFNRNVHAMMNVKIGTTDASAFEVDL